MLLLALFTACRTTPPPIDLAAPGWAIRHGQAIWKPSASETELAGELLLAVNISGQSLIQFSKSPFTLVDARTEPDRWQIDMPLRRFRASGQGKPTARFAWFQLPAIAAKHPAAGEWRLTLDTNDAWRLENPRTGETLGGFWTP